MVFDLLQIKDPAPVVAIAEAAADERADDQRDGQGARQDGIHLAVAR